LVIYQEALHDAWSTKYKILVVIVVVIYELGQHIKSLMQ